MDSSRPRWPSRVRVAPTTSRYRCLCDRNHRKREAKSGSRASVASPSVVVAASGSRPTIDRTRSGSRPPSSAASTS